MRAQLGYTTKALHQPTTNEVLQGVLKSSWLQSLIRNWLVESKRIQSSTLGSRSEAEGSALATARESQPLPGVQAAAPCSVSSRPTIDLEPHEQAKAGSRAAGTSQALGSARGVSSTDMRQAGPASPTAAIRAPAGAVSIATAQPGRPFITSGSTQALTADRQPASMATPLQETPQAASSTGRPHEQGEGTRLSVLTQTQGLANQNLSSQPSTLPAARQASQSQALPATSKSPLSARRDPRLQLHNPRGPAPRGQAQANHAPRPSSKSQPVQAFGGRQFGDPQTQSLPSRQGSLRSTLPRQNPQGSGGMPKPGSATRPGLAELPEAVGEKETAWRVS